MEKKLGLLFDYQDFEGSDRLGKLISETQGRYAQELSDDDLEDIAAAGIVKRGIRGIEKLEPKK